MVAILVVLTIILFVAADLILQWVRARREAPAPRFRSDRVEVADLLLPAVQPEQFQLPAGLFFHRGHTWLNLLFSGQVKVGIDDFTQKLLGRVDGISLPAVGTAVMAGRPFATLRQAGRTLTVCAPVDGTVCAVNGELFKTPHLLRRDPYTRGWLVALQPTDLTPQLGGLMVGARALQWLGGELGRLREFLGSALAARQDALVGLTAADGGLLAEGLLEQLDDATWAQFQDRFLRA